MSLVECLQDAQLLAGLEPAELEAFAALTTRRQVPQGHVLLRMGERNESLFIICSGSASVDRTVEGQDVWLAALGQGQTFGEMSLLDGSPAAATVTAGEPMEVAELKGDALEKLCAERPLLWGKLWRNVALDLKRRLVETSDLVCDYVDIDKVLTDVPSFGDNLGHT